MGITSGAEASCVQKDWNLHLGSCKFKGVVVNNKHAKMYDSIVDLRMYKPI